MGWLLSYSYYINKSYKWKHFNSYCVVERISIVSKIYIQFQLLTSHLLLHPLNLNLNQSVSLKCSLDISVTIPILLPSFLVIELLILPLIFLLIFHFFPEKKKKQCSDRLKVQTYCPTAWVQILLLQ